MGSIISIQLTEDSTDMALNRLLANPQDMGDLLVGIAVGYVVENLDLPGAQRGHQCFQSLSC